MDGSNAGDRKLVPLGHIAGVHGLRGWLKIHSLTEPREAIFEYQPWLLGPSLREILVTEGKAQGKGLIALLEGVESREQAEGFLGQEIAVYRDQFPKLPGGQYYWADLMGLSVRLENGRELGTVERMLATGANDVMVVRGDRERLIPFIPGPYVKQVDLESGVVTVDWDPEF